MWCNSQGFFLLVLFVPIWNINNDSQLPLASAVRFICTYMEYKFHKLFVYGTSIKFYLYLYGI